MYILNHCFFLLEYISLSHTKYTKRKKREYRTNENLSQWITGISIWISPKNFLNQLYFLILFSYMFIILYKSLKIDQLYLCLWHVDLYVGFWFALFCLFPRAAMSPWLWMPNNVTKLYSSGHNFKEDITRYIPMISIQIFYYFQIIIVAKNKCKHIISCPRPHTSELREFHLEPTNKPESICHYHFHY